jgi:esterase/lipase superfamily enzyme
MTTAPLLSAILASGCATTSASWRERAAAPQVSVFYATDRRMQPPPTGSCSAGALGSPPVRFGGERGTGVLSFGVFPVKLPTAQRLGETPPIIERAACSPPDPVYLAGANQESEEEFAQSVGSALEWARAKEILVFIHGYNFGFDEAVIWAAQLKHDLRFQGVIVVYSWPSRGSRWSYLADLNNADWTTPHLARFLETLASRANGAPIHLLSHSMGSRATLSALHGLAVERREGPPPHFGQIIFAAPDVDADVFRHLVPPVLFLAERVTLYTASDLALRISGWLFAYPRAGDSEPELVLVSGMDTVDVTAVDDSRMRHDYFLENERVLADIFQLLTYGAPPQTRFRLFGVQLRGLLVWQFRS